MGEAGKAHPFIVLQSLSPMYVKAARRRQITKGRLLMMVNHGIGVAHHVLIGCVPSHIALFANGSQPLPGG